MQRVFLTLLCAFLLAPPARAAQRPNFLFILAEDLGARDLGCYGSRFYRTPNIDRLAKEGMKFNAGYAACPVCSPSRAAILTGKYPARLNLTDWLPGRPDRPDQALARPKIEPQLPLSETTLAEALQDAGYATGHVGKWHLGDRGFLPEDQGFDVNVAGTKWGYPFAWYPPFERKLRDGSIPLLGKHARVHGTMLRWEPMPHKNTLGYWVNESDTVSWEFIVKQPGTFDVIVTQGCGKGQGGSLVEFAVGDERVEMLVADTGHFQNFVDRKIGRIRLAETGRHTFTVKPLKKAKNAVMDLPKVVLQPVR